MPKTRKECSVNGCSNLTVSYKGIYCNRHDIQMKRHGKIANDLFVDDLPGEEWRDIKGFRGKYQVSNHGRIKSLAFNRNKLLSPFNDSKRRVLFIRCGQVSPRPVKRIVIEHFLTENPFNDKRVLFIDGDYTNCSSDNMAYYGQYWYEKTLSLLKKETKPTGNTINIIKFMEGDNDALNKILSEQTRKLKLFLVMFLRKRHIARVKLDTVDIDDIVQTSLIKAVGAIKRGLLKPPLKIDAWFGTIAMNTAANLINSTPYMFYETGNYKESSAEYNYIDYAAVHGTIDQDYVDSRTAMNACHV